MLRPSGYLPMPSIKLLALGLGFLFASSTLPGNAQDHAPRAVPPGLPELKPGDLLFQDLDLGPLCEAIEAVTEGAGGKDFSHVAIAVDMDGGIRIVEAIGEQAAAIGVEAFFARSGKVFVGRVQGGRTLRERAAQEAVRLIGTPYDDAFLLDQEQLYCSELVALVYQRANGGAPLFTTPPMTFKDPATGAFFPAWIGYYEQLRLPIPEGEPGCNPGGLSREPVVRIVWRGF
jgi:hypothetical protein